MMNIAKTPPHQDDEFDRLLRSNVHPAQWKNPTPDNPYNLVVLGGGTAGLVTASIGAGLGAKVALIERHLMGGDCLNVGCVPSKAIIRAARVLATIKESHKFGLTFPGDVQHDFGCVMSRMRRVRSELSRVDSAERFKELGIDVFIGNGQFASSNTLTVDGTTLKFSHAVICTGTNPAPLNVSGLGLNDYLTNESIFSITKLPQRLAVIGAGPVGCELAQAFARFGSQVTLLEEAEKILPREDSDASEIVQNQLNRDGVQVLCNTTIKSVEVRPNDKRIHYGLGNQATCIDVDSLLASVGRRANIQGLGLEKAGVAHTRAGITIDSHLRTTNPRIYAAGDVCFPFKFTHTAEATAKIVIQNALFPHPFGLGKVSTNSLIIPWCTYTEPEIAHVGMYKADAEAQGIKVETFTHSLSDVDRAILDGNDTGFARVHVAKGSDRILGATIVAADAGNIISAVTVAMQAGAGLSVLGQMIHPYPTQGEVLRKVANQMRKARFSQRQRAILARLFSWRR